MTKEELSRAFYLQAKIDIQVDALKRLRKIKDSISKAHICIKIEDARIHPEDAEAILIFAETLTAARLSILEDQFKEL